MARRVHDLPHGVVQQVHREFLRRVTADEVEDLHNNPDTWDEMILVMRARPTGPLLSISSDGRLLIRGLDPTNFWNRALKDDGWGAMRFPRFRVISEVTTQACVDFGLIPVFCPAGELEQVVGSGHGDRYIFPAWGKRINESEIERRPLPGRWILIETVPKPDWNNPAGYNADDKVAKLLGLEKRFATGWDTLHDGRLNKLAGVWGLSSFDTIRLPTAEEMNWVGNLFPLANRTMGTNLPNLGATASWEWCENRHGSIGHHLVFGHSGFGGLSAVLKGWRESCERTLSLVGFRVLAVLS